MSGYAVLWSNEENDPTPGLLEFTADGLMLRGGRRRRRQAQLEIPYHEIVGVQLKPKPTAGGRRTLRVSVRAASPVRIASIGGVGILAEIADLLLEILGA